MRGNVESNEVKNGGNRLCLKLSAFTFADAMRRGFCAALRPRIHPDGGGRGGGRVPKIGPPRAGAGARRRTIRAIAFTGKRR
jgi:hypothetical protein